MSEPAALTVISEGDTRTTSLSGAALKLLSSALIVPAQSWPGARINFREIHLFFKNLIPTIQFKTVERATKAHVNMVTLTNAVLSAELRADEIDFFFKKIFSATAAPPLQAPAPCLFLRPRNK